MENNLIKCSVLDIFNPIDETSGKTLSCAGF